MLKGPPAAALLCWSRSRAVRYTATSCLENFIGLHAASMLCSMLLRCSVPLCLASCVAANFSSDTHPETLVASIGVKCRGGQGVQVVPYGESRDPASMCWAATEETGKGDVGAQGQQQRLNTPHVGLDDGQLMSAGAKVRAESQSCLTVAITTAEIRKSEVKQVAERQLKPS